MKKISIKEARKIVNELTNMVSSNSEVVSFNYDDLNKIELETATSIVRVWLDYNKGLVASVYNSSGSCFHGLVSMIDDGSWLKYVWEDMAFNNGNNIIQYLKNVKHFSSICQY